MLPSAIESKVKMFMGMNWNYVFKKEPEGGWFIRVYELYGCMSQGNTLDEAYDNIREAMELWFETAISNNFLIPRPVSSQSYKSSL
jgi:antitoxin HicB